MYDLKKKKKSLPTDPLFFQPVTGNKHIFFWPNLYSAHLANKF